MKYESMDGLGALFISFEKMINKKDNMSKDSKESNASSPQKRGRSSSQVNENTVIPIGGYTGNFGSSSVK